MADLIKYSDSLRKGTDKLNDSIKDSNTAFLKANQAAVISEAAKILAESVQEQFNQVVIEGDSSVEAAQARVDSGGVPHPTLKSRLDNFEFSASQQLADVNDMKGYELKSKGRKTRPIIVFALDDGGINDIETVQPILGDRGFRASTAIITSQISNPSYPYAMTWEQVKTLHKVHGWEVASHSRNHTDLTTITGIELKNELKGSLDDIRAQGIHAENIFVPYGKTNSIVRNEMRKYFRSARISGSSSSGKGVNYSPFDMYQMDCLFFGDTDGSSSSIDPVSGKEYDTFAYFKYYIDLAIEKNAVLIIGIHGNNISINSRQIDLGVICDYIISKQVDVLPYGEMLDEVGNIIDTNNFKVGADGKIEGKYGKTVVEEQNVIISETPVSDFPTRSLTMNPITSGGAKNLPYSSGGTMLTFQPQNSDSLPMRAFQLFHAYRKDGFYVRGFDSVGNADDFYQLDLIKVWEANGLPSNHSISSLSLGRINYCFVGVSGSSGYPEGAAGFLTANRISDNNGAVTEEYRILGTSRVYKRYWNTISNEWTPFLLDIPTSRLTYNSIRFTDLISTYPFGVSYVDINLNHPDITSFPVGGRGVLETHNLFTLGNSFQYYHITNSTDTYKRVSKTDNEWTVFVKVE